MEVVYMQNVRIRKKNVLINNELLDYPKKYIAFKTLWL